MVFVCLRRKTSISIGFIRKLFKGDCPMKKWCNKCHKITKHIFVNDDDTASQELMCKQCEHTISLS
jgi:hypothetical protein